MTQQDLSQIKTLLQENNKNLATKDDLTKALVENNKNLATKDDLYENNKRLAKIFATKQDLEKMVTKEEYHQTVDQILTTLDGIYGIVKCWDEERFLLSGKISNHETRITKVEKQVFAN